MKSTSMLCLCAYALCGHSVAQNLPPELLSIMESGKESISGKDLTADQRTFFWGKSKAESAGYLRIESDIEYVNLVSDFLALPQLHHEKHRSTIAVAGNFQGKDISRLGWLKEGANRQTSIYRILPDRLAMLTVWDYIKDGARIVVFDDFINQKVGAKNGILSLSLGKGGRKSLWKLSWFDSGISYEFYVEDIIDERGMASLLPVNVVALAVSLVTDESRNEGFARTTSN